MIYLASPYAHPDPHEMEYRFHRVCEATARLLLQGEVVYSPIAHNHYLAVNFNLPRTWDFWQNLDLRMIDRADAVWVLQLDGWQKSTGVNAEITYAIQRGIPVLYLDFEELPGGKDN